MSSREFSVFPANVLEIYYCSEAIIKEKGLKSGAMALMKLPVKKIM